MTVKLPGRFILPLVVFAVLLVALAWVGLQFFASGKAQLETAKKDGRYAKIEIASGMVEGNVSLKGQESALPKREGKSVMAQRQATPTTVDQAPEPSAEKKAEQPPSNLSENAKKAEAAPVEEVTEQPIAPSVPKTPRSLEARPLEDSVPVSNEAGTIPSKQANAGLLEKVQGANLPKRDKTTNGRVADAYRKPFTASAKPKIAVVLTGVGMIADQNIQALSLPGGVTLSLSPYAASVNGLREKAQSAGHEIWLDLPMQPRNYPADDAGPMALMGQSAEIENIHRLHQVMGAATNYVGLVGAYDENFSARAGMKPMAAEIDKRGVALLLQQKGFKDPAGASYVRNAERAVQPDGSADAARQALSEAETLAKQSGSAVVTIPATPQMIDAIKEWSNGLADKNVDLAPLSAFYAPEKKAPAGNE